MTSNSNHSKEVGVMGIPLIGTGKAKLPGRNGIPCNFVSLLGKEPLKHCPVTGNMNM